MNIQSTSCTFSLSLDMQSRLLTFDLLVDLSIIQNLLLVSASLSICTIQISIHDRCKLRMQAHYHRLPELAPQSLAYHACYLAYSLCYLVAIPDGLRVKLGHNMRQCESKQTQRSPRQGSGILCRGSHACLLVTFHLFFGFQDGSQLHAPSQSAGAHDCPIAVSQPALMRKSPGHV